MCDAVAKNVSFTDRNVTAWIFAAMGLGGALANFVITDPEAFFAPVTMGATNLPINIGLVIAGFAPCIGTVLVWNDLAKGNREFVAGLGALNSILKILLYSTCAWFLITVLPPYFVLEGKIVPVTISDSSVFPSG